MSKPLMSVEVRLEPDILLARQRARQIAGLLGFPPLDQTRIATAASEIARNSFEFAGGGRVEFLIDTGPSPGLVIRIRERGIRELRAILEGAPSSSAAINVGVIGARRLMDRFEVESAPGGGITVVMGKGLPRRGSPLGANDLARIAAELAHQAPRGLFEELQQQNQELLRTLEELRDRQAELAQMHARELDETNRGVVALYAELDDNAQALKRISDLKSRFLSNMSHEFRSPLNTILSLSGFLLDRQDGALSAEQEKEVRFIRKAAEGLSVLVNDLLDLAKVEAGKAVVRVESFEVAHLFEGLKGAIAPLVGQGPLTFHVEEPSGIAPLLTDEGKVAQILRNFLSNALKFTERGEIRLSAAPGPGDTVLFSVSDTGIGIAPADRGRIFEEFGQVEGSLQARAKGTGLGLPLSRKLAELIGGAVSFRSEPGVGSTFFAVIPRTFREPLEAGSAPDPRSRIDPARRPVLVVEDDSVDLLLYAKHLEGSPFQVLPARTIDEANRILRRVRPTAVLLDILADAENGWNLLAGLKQQEATRSLPVYVVTSFAGEDRAAALGADGFHRKPIDQGWLLRTLESLASGGPAGRVRVLVVDDEESHRYLLKEGLAAHGSFLISEAADGPQALLAARRERPDAIILDLIMPGLNGFQVLEDLKNHPDTRDIPVIIYTSKALDDGERARLGESAAAILPKASGSRDDLRETIRMALTKAGLVPNPIRAEP